MKQQKTNNELKYIYKNKAIFSYKQIEEKKKSKSNRNINSSEQRSEPKFTNTHPLIGCKFSELFSADV